MRRTLLAIVAAAVASASLRRSQPRSAWARSLRRKMTDAQKKAVEEFVKARPDGPFGFWWGYLRVPEVMIPFLRSRRTSTASWKPRRARWARS